MRRVGSAESALIVERRRDAGAQRSAEAGGGNHRRVVGGQRQRSARRPAGRRAAPRAAASARNRLLAETPPAMPTLRAPNQLRGLERPIEQRLDHDPLEAGADVGDLRGGSARRVAGAAARLAPVRSRTSRSTAVFSPLKLKSIRARPRRQHPRVRGRCDRRGSGARSGKRKARSLPVARQPIDRPARPDIPARAAWPPCRTPPPPHRRASGRAARYAAGLGDQIQAGVSAGHDQDDGRQRHLAVLRAPATRCARRDGAPAISGMPRAHANALANDTPTSSEPTRPGPCVTAIASNRATTRRPSAERPLDHAADIAHVLARGQLGHDAAPLAVNRHLRGDDVGADRPRRRAGVAGLFDQRPRRSRRSEVSMRISMVQRGMRPRRRALRATRVGRARRCPSR